MLEEHVQLSGHKGLEMVLEGRDKGTDRLQGPASVAAWTASQEPCSLLHLRLPLMFWTLRAFPPDFFLRPSYHILRREVTIFRGMPLLRQIGVRGSQAIGFHHR